MTRCISLWILRNLETLLNFLCSRHECLVLVYALSASPSVRVLKTTSSNTGHCMQCICGDPSRGIYPKKMSFLSWNR
jgi:hypothetical protein